MTENEKEKVDDKKLGAVIGAATALGIAKFYLDKAFALAERAVVAMEKNAAATEKLASCVDKDHEFHVHIPGVVDVRER